MILLAVATTGSSFITTVTCCSRQSIEVLMEQLVVTNFGFEGSFGLRTVFVISGSVPFFFGMLGFLLFYGKASSWFYLICLWDLCFLLVGPWTGRSWSGILPSSWAGTFMLIFYFDTIFFIFVLLILRRLHFGFHIDCFVQAQFPNQYRQLDYLILLLSCCCQFLWTLAILWESRPQFFVVLSVGPFLKRFGCLGHQQLVIWI